MLPRYFMLATRFFRKHDQTKHFRRPHLATVRLHALSTRIGRLPLHCRVRRPRISPVGHRDTSVILKLPARCGSGGRGALRVMETRAPRTKDGHSCDGLRKGANHAAALRAATGRAACPRPCHWPKHVPGSLTPGGEAGGDGETPGKKTETRENRNAEETPVLAPPRRMSLLPEGGGASGRRRGFRAEGLCGEGRELRPRFRLFPVTSDLPCASLAETGKTRRGGGGNQKRTR